MWTWLVAALLFLLDETPAVAFPPLYLTSQLLFSTLYPSFCTHMAYISSAVVLAPHFCLSVCLLLVIYAYHVWLPCLLYSVWIG